MQKQHLPLLIISICALAVIIIYAVGMRSFSNVQQFSINSTATTSSDAQKNSGAKPSSGGVLSPPAPVAGTAIIIKDDLARFWIVWSGRKYLLSPSALSVEKANLLATVDWTQKQISAIDCATSLEDKVVSVEYDLFLIKSTLKYKLPVKIVSGNYSGSLPTGQGCLLPSVK